MNTRARNWMRGLGAIVALAIAFGIGFAIRGNGPTTTTTSHTEESQATIWTCSMHPQIQMPRPGQCPICGMDLIPLQSEPADTGPRTLKLSPAAMALAEIETTPVVRHSVKTTLRMVGKLEPDESRIREISAWVPGRIERLYIDSTGIPVRQGQPLFELYSPELYSAQEELLQAIKAAEELRRSSLESTRQSASRTVDAARERLRLWGLTSEQIRDIETRGTPSERVSIVAPMSGTVLHKAAVEGSYVQTGTHVYTIADLSMLWLKLDVYEADLAWIRLAQDVVFSTEAFPGVSFAGRVSFIEPVLDERSRSVKVRVDVENPDGRLKPGMFARAELYASVSSPDDQLPLVIPRSAPLVTGTRAVVYVALPDQPGRFEGRQVVLGRSAGDLVVVLEGLREGEQVVSHGAFKIDSALQIQAKPSMMNPVDDVPGSSETASLSPEHHAGSMDMSLHADVPLEFRQQVDAILLHYYRISDALSHDDLGRAQKAAQQLPAAAQAAPSALLPASADKEWKTLQHEMVQAAEDIARASDIDTARQEFVQLSQHVIHAVRRLGAGGSTAVHIFHCPMAQQGRGADWLQPFDGVENPYYGAQMFRCGERSETLVEAPAPTARPGQE